MASGQCRHCGKINLPEARFCANCSSSLNIPIITVTEVVHSTTPPRQAAFTEYEGFGKRFLAAIIDAAIIAFLLYIVSSRYHFSFSSWIVYIFFGLLYHWLFIGLRGQTIGKMAVGIKVINDSGSPPGLGPAALREIIGKLLSTIFFFLGFLWMIGDKKKEGWHDKIAGTNVVKAHLKER